MFRNGVLPCQREYVGKKQVHDIRTLWPFREVLSAQESFDKDRHRPPTGPLSMTGAKYRNKLKAEADLRLQQSSIILDTKLMCLPKQPHPSHRHIKTESFVLFCWLIKPAVKLLCYLICYKKSVRSTLFFYVAYIANSKTGVRFREIFQSGKGFDRPLFFNYAVVV
jgi:hypothetical protein